VAVLYIYSIFSVRVRNWWTEGLK